LTSIRREEFSIGTCEQRVRGHIGPPFEPSEASWDAPFEITDPFGLRSAVLPVFRCDPDGYLFGQGTAFHVDGCGGVLTAEHVVDFARDGFGQPGGKRTVSPLEYDHPVLMLSPGLAYGVTKLPPWALCASAEQRWLLAQAEADPLDFLGSASTHRVAADVAALQLGFDPTHRPASVPVRLAPWNPEVGDTVLAVGFPLLMPNEQAVDELRLRIVDRLYGAYGTVVAIRSTGTSRTSSTPVFELRADWPSGTSGGPVFNRNGEVVGVVSRSLAPADGSPGVGFAAAIGLIPGVRDLVPQVHPLQPGWRLGFGVVAGKNHRLSGVFGTVAEAQQFQASLGQDYVVRRGSYRIGSSDFVTSFASFGT
jgi:serine protease Do